MEQQQFLSLLESLSSLSSDQVTILKNALPEPDTLDIRAVKAQQVLEAIEETFPDCTVLSPLL